MNPTPTLILSHTPPLVTSIPVVWRWIPLSRNTVLRDVGDKIY